MHSADRAGLTSHKDRLALVREERKPPREVNPIPIAWIGASPEHRAEFVREHADAINKLLLQTEADSTVVPLHRAAH